MERQKARVNFKDVSNSDFVFAVCSCRKILILLCFSFCWVYIESEAKFEYIAYMKSKVGIVQLLEIFRTIIFTIK